MFRHLERNQKFPGWSPQPELPWNLLVSLLACIYFIYTIIVRPPSVGRHQQSLALRTALRSGFCVHKQCLRTCYDFPALLLCSGALKKKESSLFLVPPNSLLEPYGEKPSAPSSALFLGASLGATGFSPNVSKREL
jgi:hypothetical protein